ncbi:hypothetical protein ES288_D02G197100v1 [Gossypium darwinii]|uniref:VWFA domain-containing protein n=1 Tax=Gossypium darwinii TaxID=34276 RepID=A0A5D2DI33_GOSDA|nr:hypothetical protein ES288_D02G197100v1 [Gossypium darwinii]
MVLEATMICIDKSEWMRNGDYSLSRFQAQLMLLSNSKNMVGILTMAGKRVRVLATPTSELGKILSCMYANLYHDLCKACSSVRNPYEPSSWNSDCLVGSKASPKQKLAANDYSFCWKFSFEMIGKVVGAALIIAGLYLVILGKSEESKYLSKNEPIYSVSKNNAMESTFIWPLLGNKLQS